MKKIPFQFGAARAVGAILLDAASCVYAQTGTQTELVVTNWKGATLSGSSPEGIVTLK